MIILADIYTMYIYIYSLVYYNMNFLIFIIKTVLILRDLK